MTTESLLYSAFKQGNLPEYIEIFRKNELQVILSEFSKSKYKTKDYEKFCDISAEYILKRLLRVHNMPYIDRFYKNYTMEILIGIVLLSLATTGNTLCAGYDIFQETEVKSLNYKLVDRKDRNREIRYYDMSLLSFFAMFDYASSVDYILNEVTRVFCAANNKCYANQIRDDINYILFGTNKQNLFEVAVMFGSITTIIMLMNKYRPIIRRDINVIIRDSLFPEKDEIHELIYTYRKMYTLMGYKKGNNIKYYSLQCSDPDCDNSDCEKNKRRTNRERKKLVYTDEKFNILRRKYKKCIKNIYKSII